MHIRMWLALALAALGISTTALAGTNSWTDLGPDGGSVWKVVFHPTAANTVYAGSLSGLYRSQDAGGTWQLLKDGFTIDVEIDPAHPERIYRTIGSHLEVSNDGGITFAPPAGYPANAIGEQVEISADGMTLYASGGRRTYRSTDGGATWAEGASIPAAAGDFSSITQILIDPADSRTVYALANSAPSTRSIFLSADGAASWELVQTSTPNSNFIQQLAASGNPRRLWLAAENNVSVSSDRGRHLSPVNFQRFTISIAVDPTDADTLYAGVTEGKVFRTGNAGATWVEVTGNLLGIELVSGLFVNAARPAEVFAAGQSGLARTISGGVTWSLRQSGINSTGVYAFSANPARDRIYLRSSAAGVHYIEGDAPRAAQLNLDALQQAIQFPRFAGVRALHAQEGVLGRLFAALTNDFLRSVDGGNSWQALTLPVAGNNNITSITSAPDAPNVLFAATSTNGAFRSADGGNNWFPASTGFPANILLQQVEAARSDPRVVYAVPLLMSPIGESPTGLGVYRWVDAAAKWEAANTGIATEYVSQVAVDPSNAQVVYAAGQHGLWKTTNGGAAWTQLAWNDPPSSAASAVAVDPADPQIIYAAGGGPPRRSVDGTTWETLDDPQRFPGSFSVFPGALIVDPVSPDTILIGTGINGAQRLTVAPDLAIEATSTPSGPASVGSTLTYSFRALNLGPFATTDTQIRLQLPAGTNGISAEPASSCVVAGAIVTCTVGALRAGFASAVTLHASPAAFGQFTVAASTGARQPDPVTTNNSTTATAAITPVSDIGVQATGTVTARVGEAVSYSLTVANAGPDAATDVQLSYQLGAGLTAGSATASRGSCTVAPRVVTCSFGDIAAQASATVTINATASAEGAQTSTASLTTATVEGASANNSAAVITTVAAASTGGGGGSNGGSSGGGGGGSFSLYSLLVLALFTAMRVRSSRPRRRLRPMLCANGA